MSRSFLCSGSSGRKIDNCLFCRCRGVSCVQGARMIYDCSLCRCRGLSFVKGVLLG